jgi:predicted secreted protein
MKQILFVSHCVLNTASKVKSYKTDEMAREEALRRRLVHAAVDQGVQLIQLPCPEFLQYGARRWGHTCDQFDNVFFRDYCRRMLGPVLVQIQEYLENPEEFELLGVLGIDGSPSCGVKYTCRAPWGGEFSGRDVTDLLKSCKLSEGSGVMITILGEMLAQKGITMRMEGLFAPQPERALSMLEPEKKL